MTWYVEESGIVHHVICGYDGFRRDGYSGWARGGIVVARGGIRASEARFCLGASHAANEAIESDKPVRL